MFNNLQFNFEREYINATLKDLMIQAEDDLFKYIHNRGRDNEEIQAGAPIYYAELKRGETIDEIKEYMKKFTKMEK